MKTAFLKPFRIAKVQKYINKKTPVFLDVGCGNNSPSITKQWMPSAIYHGIDYDKNNLTEKDHERCDAFYELDIDRDDLSSIENNYYDVINFSHVIEHLVNGDNTISNLMPKLKTDGIIFIETPSEKSLRLPSGVGTLNFYDDKTHVRFYSIGEIGNILLNNKLEILEAGRRREIIRVLATPLYIPLQISTLYKYKRLHARGLWDILGFADYIIARKNTVNSASENE